MSTLTIEIEIEPSLVKRLEQIASEQAVMPKELLETAVRAYLRQVERQKIQTEIAAFHEMHSRLLEEYPGQFVAIHGGTVVDHDQDFKSLHNRVRQRFGQQPVLLRCVTNEPERTLVFHSAGTMGRLALFATVYR